MALVDFIRKLLKYQKQTVRQSALAFDSSSKSNGCRFCWTKYKKWRFFLYIRTYKSSLTSSMKQWQNIQLIVIVWRFCNLKNSLSTNLFFYLNFSWCARIRVYFQHENELPYSVNDILKWSLLETPGTKQTECARSLALTIRAAQDISICI